MGQAVVRVVSGAPALPRLFAPDEAAARRFLFTANIRNLNTRRAYARAAVMLRDAAVFDHRAQARGSAHLQFCLKCARAQFLAGLKFRRATACRAQPVLRIVSNPWITNQPCRFVRANCLRLFREREWPFLITILGA